MFIQVFGVGVLTALASLDGAAAARQESPAPAPTAAAPTAPSSTRPVKSPGNAQWAATAEEARVRAASEHKLVYYEFESPKCGNCARMHSLLYPAFDFEALMIGMVPVRLQLGSDDGGIAERFKITEAPAVVILTPTDRLVFLMHGFKDPQDFYAHVHKDLDANRELQKTLDAQDVSRLPARDALHSAHELFERLDYAEARPRFKRAAAAPDATSFDRDAALEGLAACELRLNRAPEARRTIEELITTTQDPDRKERAELFRAQIPLSLNQTAEALALYKKFERDHPQSRYLGQVREFIARLEPGEAPK